MLKINFYFFPSLLNNYVIKKLDDEIKELNKKVKKAESLKITLWKIFNS